jgi:hypothetical protein
VVVHYPQNAQREYRIGSEVVVEVLQRQIDAELIGDSEIELREVFDEVIVDSGQRRLCLDCVLEIQRLLASGSRCCATRSSLEALRVSVELAPGWLAGGSIRL